MRLIDADVLYKTFMDGETDTEEERILNQLARYLIRHASSVDAVPVVRCLECKNLIAAKADNGNTIQVCNRTKFPVCFDDFCSRGEKLN